MKYLWAVLIVLLTGAAVLKVMLADPENRDQPVASDDMSSPSVPSDADSDSPFAISEGNGDASENGDAPAFSSADAVPGNELPVQAEPPGNVDVTALQPPLSEDELGRLVNS